MKCLIKIPNIKYGSSLRYGCGPYMTPWNWVKFMFS